MATGLGLVGYESSDDEANSEPELISKVGLTSCQLLWAIEGWMATNEQDNNRSTAIAMIPTPRQNARVCDFNHPQVLPLT